MFRDAGGWPSCAGAEVDANGGGERFGAELTDDSLCADFGGRAGYEAGDAGVPDEGEGVLDAGSKEWMEPGERTGS